MNKLMILLLMHFFVFTELCGQETERFKLKVRSMQEFSECYLITAIKNSNYDSVYLISKKDSLKSKRKYEPIIIGQEYNFTIRKLKLMANPPDSNFRIVVGRDILWKVSDGPNKFPYYSKNTVGRFIRKS